MRNVTYLLTMRNVQSQKKKIFSKCHILILDEGKEREIGRNEEK